MTDPSQHRLPGQPVPRAQRAGDDHVLDLLDGFVGDGHDYSAAGGAAALPVV